MKLYFAPLEGVTDHIFRNIHHRRFGGADKYYTPFFSPTSDGTIPPRDRKELEPETNRDLPVVPQLLTKRGEDFLWAARALTEMGYREVNLNIGCPSGTVTAKGKSSGILDRREDLERLLDGIFADAPCAVSVKTRLGRKEPEEFRALLELFNRYPIAELTVHCRVGEDFYRRPGRPEWLDYALRESKNPVCCNGDLTTTLRVEEFRREHPQAPAVMLGRGGVADPALFRRLKGGPGAGRKELEEYTGELFEAYSRSFGSSRRALGRMKEIWFYQICLFEETEELEKMLKKAADPYAYESAVGRIFAQCPLREDGARPAW